MKFSLSALVFFNLAIAPALSAESIAVVTSVEGKVLLNQGEGFQVVNKLATLGEGDQILVSKDAAVSLNYAAAGCAPTFSDPSLVTVSSSAPCPNNSKASKSSSSGGGGGGAVSGSAQRSSTPVSIPALGGSTSRTAPTTAPTTVSLP